MDSAVLTAQVTALARPRKANLATEEQRRILRHDLRHYLHILSSRLRAGDGPAALQRSAPACAPPGWRKRSAMTSDSFWSCLCAISTMLTGCLFATLLVDDWRFSKERLRIMLPVILLLAALSQVLCFRFLDLNRANLAVTYLDVTVLLLAPALVHWRKRRLLFSMAVAYSFTFSTVFFSHLLFPSFGPENLAVRLISLAVMALFLARRFGPSLRRAFQIEIGGWYGLSLRPLLFAFLFFTQTC